MYGETDFTQELLSSAWPDWKLSSRLGRGSYGSVYEIYRDDLGTRYTGALKVLYIETGDPEDSTIPDAAFPLPPASAGTDGSSASGSSSAHPFLQYASDSMIEDFIVSVSAEIRTMIDLKGHPHIVSIEDYAVRRGKGFCAILIRMEKLEALNAYIRRTGSMSRSEVIRLGSEICDALSLCEKKNIIHRDIKLGNLFFSEKTGYKLGDFGISRTMSSIYEKASMSGSGTPQYMAPEVYRGERYNNTADLYSLGMVLYILMNDFVPPLCRDYPGSTDRMAVIHQANMRRMQGEPLPRPSLADDRLAAVILRACSPNPEQRFPTADAFKKALQQCTVPASAPDKSGGRMQSRIVRNFPTQVSPADSSRSRVGTDPYAASSTQPVSSPSGGGQNQKPYTQSYTQSDARTSGCGERPYAQSSMDPSMNPSMDPSMDPSGGGDNPYARPAAGPSGYGDYTDPGTPSGTGRGGQDHRRLPLLPIIGVLCLAAVVIILVTAARLAGGKDSSHETADKAPADSQVTSSGGAADGGEEEAAEDTESEDTETEAVTAEAEAAPETEAGAPASSPENPAAQADSPAAQANSPAAESDTPETVTRSMTDPIEWSDSTLRDAVCNYLAFDGTMTYKDASAVKELDLTEAGITDISDLEYFTRIETLDLAGNSVEDLSPLAGLHSLKSLHLENNKISDLSPISGLTGLDHLDLCGNFLTDISDLKDLKSLKMLDIRENFISDISVLEDKVLMTDLFMGSNQISDISCLAGMTGLNYLNISYNEIEDISVVGNMTDLRVLTMTSNKIKDISCLRNCPKIYHLKMKENLVTDFSVLDTLKSLDHIEHD